MRLSISSYSFFCKGLGGLHDRVGVGVFSLEVGGDLGILFVAHPGVVIDQRAPVDFRGLGNFFGHGRSRNDEASSAAARHECESRQSYQEQRGNDQSTIIRAVAKISACSWEISFRGSQAAPFYTTIRMRESDCETAGAGREKYLPGARKATLIVQTPRSKANCAPAGRRCSE